MVLVRPPQAANHYVVRLQVHGDQAPVVLWHRDVNLMKGGQLGNGTGNQPQSKGTPGPGPWQGTYTRTSTREVAVLSSYKHTGRWHMLQFALAGSLHAVRSTPVSSCESESTAASSWCWYSSIRRSCGCQ